MSQVAVLYNDVISRGRIIDIIPIHSVALFERLLTTTGFPLQVKSGI